MGTSLPDAGQCSLDPIREGAVEGVPLGTSTLEMLEEGAADAGAVPFTS
jgi:hypothetical protein